MARITINEAAKQGFKSRSQINKDVRSGKLPHTVEKGTKVLDVADLIQLPLNNTLKIKVSFI